MLEFIQGLAETMKPLYTLTKSRAPFEWTERCEHAFQQLKRDMSTTPVLAFPNNDDPFILGTDAFDTTIGAALYQIQNGVERPVSFASHTLTPAQTRYCTTRKELLPIVVFTRHYKHYCLVVNSLLGPTTDHLLGYSDSNILRAN